VGDRRKSPRTASVFATHFHELTDLARERTRQNLSMAVKE
jgi:DNA mismatch repair ATPase MutS